MNLSGRRQSSISQFSHHSILCRELHRGFTPKDCKIFGHDKDVKRENCTSVQRKVQHLSGHCHPHIMTLKILPTMARILKTILSRLWDLAPQLALLDSFYCNVNIWKFHRDEPVLKQKLGHRKVDWNLQVEVITKDIKVDWNTNWFKSFKTYSGRYFQMLNVQEASIYTYTPGRQMPGANGYTRNLSFDFKVYTVPDVQLN